MGWIKYILKDKLKNYKVKFSKRTFKRFKFSERTFKRLWREYFVIVLFGTEDELYVLPRGMKLLKRKKEERKEKKIVATYSKRWQNIEG